MIAAATAGADNHVKCSTVEMHIPVSESVFFQIFRRHVADFDRKTAKQTRPDRMIATDDHGGNERNNKNCS